MQQPRLETLQTPCLVLDQAKVAANAARLKAHLAKLGVPLRLHVKTAKSAPVTDLVLGGQKAPICVSTLKEAEVFFDEGYRDILYAVGFTPDKLARAQALVKHGAKLTLVVDNAQAAAGITGFPVLIEIDSDGHRSGLKPDDAQLVPVAKALQAAGNTVAGVMTHAGDSYNCGSIEAIRKIAERERDGVLTAAKILRAAGFPAPIVSVGSSPTATYAEDLAGVTEVRAGVFVFFDLVMAGIEVCRQVDIALSVMGSVIGHRADKNWLITDAGWMAMSRDRGTQKQKVDQGYGVVCDVEGKPIPGLVMVDANQEHGIIARRDGGPLPELPVGTRLRILPNHACATGAQHEEYNVVNGGREVSAVWKRFSGW
jgi:D-serine deaminase-like pyridoxal phosphate-dependent protein